MKDILKRIPKRWVVVVATILSVILLTGVVYGANMLVVSFGGGLGVTGKITVVSPAPDTNTVTVVVDDITVSTDNLYSEFYATVTNNSDWDLTYEGITLTCPKEFVVQFDPNEPRVSAFNHVLPSHGSQKIPLMFIVLGIDPTLPRGDYEYSGEISYSW